MGIIEFVKRHWVAYVIGAVLAVALGFAAAFVVLQIGTTHDDAANLQIYTVFMQTARMFGI